MNADYPHAEYIRALVDKAPPLTEAQRSLLAAIFRPPRAAASGDSPSASQEAA